MERHLFVDKAIYEFRQVTFKLNIDNTLLMLDNVLLVVEIIGC